MTAIRNIELADNKSRAELLEVEHKLRTAWPHVKPTISIEPRADIWPEVEGLMDNLTTMAVTEHADGARNIRLVKEFVEDHDLWVAELRMAQQNGILSDKVPADRPAQFVLTHEWGHVMHAEAFGTFEFDGLTGDGIGGETDMHFRRAVSLAWEAVGMGHVPVDEVPDAWGYSKILTMLLGQSSPLAEDLSRYAEDTPNELVAEAFAVHTLAPGTSAAADAVYEYLVTTYAAAS